MAIITLQNLKDFLGITGTSEDTKLGFIVDNVNAFVNTYCNRTLESTTYTDELYDGPGYAALVLKNYPIVSIDSIEVNTEAVYERMDIGKEGYYIMDADQGIIYNNDLWPRGRGNIKITYTAGYAANAIPKDLYYACLSLGAYYRNIHAKSGVLSQNLGSYAYSLATGLNSMNGELTIPDVAIKNTLDRYRKNVQSVVF